MPFTRLHTDIEAWLADASNLAGGCADEVCLPENEDDVAEILKDCAARQVPVTISGNRTGLAGGGVPTGGTVLSLGKMNRILSVDPATKSAVVQPGVVLRDFQDRVEGMDLLYPPDPTERGGQIGGNVATNASGARTFKYGPTRDWISGLRVLLSTGERLALRRGRERADGCELALVTEEGSRIDVRLPDYPMPSVSKHAAGYFSRPDMDAVDLFIGSEGTLGVVTEIELRLIDLPEHLFSGVVFFADEEKMLDFTEEVRERSRSGGEQGNRLEGRAIEFIDANALDFIRGQFPSIPEGAGGGAIWFESEGDSDEQIAAWADVIERHTPLMNDSWFALTEKDQKRMREFRHAVPSSAYEFITRHGMRKFGTDMAVPDGRFREMYRFYRTRLAESGLTNLTWGHIGNSHLHVNLLPEREEQVPVAKQLYDEFVAEALRLGGTVSAEHGIGKIKTAYLRRMFGDQAIGQMIAVRRALDPAGILGRGTMTG